MVSPTLTTRCRLVEQRFDIDRVATKSLHLPAPRSTATPSAATTAAERRAALYRARSAYGEAVPFVWRQPAATADIKLMTSSTSQLALRDVATPEGLQEIRCDGPAGEAAATP